jgi:hypothetical protein
LPAWSRATQQDHFDILKKASDEILARNDQPGDLSQAAELRGSTESRC